jgi:5,5'-dehydrodivanillate O-demethylase oxygenase subunit
MDEIKGRKEELQLLTQCARGTLMGTLLRSFWQPVALAESVAPGKARFVRVMGEDLTLYRGASGTPYLVGGRCAHRATVLHTGWVEGEEIRCIYHGWRYAGSGRCTERPAERRVPPDGIRIASYPVRDYAGLVFAYLGAGAVPEFELPRKPVLEDESRRRYPVEQVWDCNWLQQVENSLDAVHVSFVHVWGRMSRFGEEIRTAIPQLAYDETSAGIRQVATRSKTNVRISDWTFPNNNHIVSPGPQKGDPWLDTVVWAVPADDTHTMRFTVNVVPKTNDEETDRRIAWDRTRTFNPADHYDALFNRHEVPDAGASQLISTQDYVAVRGQGEIFDRTQEWLGDSDAGIVLLRRIFFRELEAIRAGLPTKRWEKLDEAAALPIQIAEAAAE